MVFKNIIVCRIALPQKQMKEVIKTKYKEKYFFFFFFKGKKNRKDVKGKTKRKDGRPKIRGHVCFAENVLVGCQGTY